MPALTSARRSELRARAHALSPVVIVGDKGLTDAVIAEVDRALRAHELIKVKAAAGEREARAGWMATLCERLDAHPVQSIGKILVLWRENPEKAAAKPAPAPKAKPKPKSKSKRVAAKEPIRTSRPRSPAPSPPRESEPRRRRPRTSR
jgi:RNA-binding protein